MTNSMYTGGHRVPSRTDAAEPKVPFWKDERLKFTHLTAAGIVRLVLVAVAGFAVVMALVAWRVVELSTTNHQLYRQQQQQITQGRKDRLAYQQQQLQLQQALQAQQRYTQDQVAALACIFVAGVPDSLDPRVAPFRARYHCPPYKPAAALSPQPGPTGPATGTAAPSTAAPSVSPQQLTASTMPATPSASPAAPAASSPAPTRSVPPSIPGTGTGPLAPVASLACSLTGVCIG